MAHKGRAIIVGRGGVTLTQDIRDSLHIFMYAPKKWRIKTVQKDQNLPKSKAEEFIDRIDRERSYLKNMYAGDDVTYRDYDIGFNCSTLNKDKIEELIFEFAQQKQFF